MTERLADIAEHITGIRQLGTVVNAMRGIAAARAQQARSQLAAVDRYTATIAAAIAQALPLIPADAPSPIEPSGKLRLALVLFCAEQGFAGAFSERILDAAGSALHTADLFLIGTRGHAVLAERGIAAGWTGTLPSHSPGIPKLADRVAQALYAKIAAGKIDRIDAIYSHWQPGQGTRIERKHLLPFDMAAFAPPSPVKANPPMLYLPPGIVVQALTADYCLPNFAVQRCMRSQLRTKRGCRPWRRRGARSSASWLHCRQPSGRCGRKKSPRKSSSWRRVRRQAGRAWPVDWRGRRSRYNPTHMTGMASCLFTRSSWKPGTGHPMLSLGHRDKHPAP
jgi:F-type H+-transporting ATPase subunit gamma